MNPSNRTRRIVALIAAYVVALQALLLPLSVAAGANFDSVLCVASSAESPQHPAGGDTGCACAAGCGMQCCAQALAPPPPSDFAPASVQIGALVPPPALAAVPQPREREPHAARAPPSA